MRLLYLCHRIPYPPDKGEKIRAFNQVAYLARQHAVHVACLVDDRKDLAHVAALERHCASVDAVYRNRDVARLRGALALLGRRSLSLASFHSRELEARVHRRLQAVGVDAILVYSSAMAQYVPRRCCIPTVIDFVDVDSAKWLSYAERARKPLSWLYRVEAWRLRRYEIEIARTFDHSIFVSRAEADLVRDSFAGRPVSVIPTGVDLEYFRPGVVGAAPLGAPVIAFVGTMDYLPNIDAVVHFCTAVLPKIRRLVPGAQFWIVGRNPARAVRALARRAGVTVTGAVPDVRPYFARAAVSVAPFRISRGVQSKILESMAMGVPVVGTRIAFQGIDVTGGDGVEIEDDPEAFAERVAGLLRDGGSRDANSQAARRFVERHHRWEEHGAALSSILTQVSRKSPEEVEHVRDCGRR